MIDEPNESQVMRLSFHNISFISSTGGFVGFWFESGFHFFKRKPKPLAEANSTLFKENLLMID